MDLYDIFFSICIGLFIGGLILSFISFFLAQMESNIVGEGEIDVDVDIDVDIDVDVDIDADVDVDIDADVDVDIDADVDVDIDADVDVDIDVDTDVDVTGTATPAPIMLLLSAASLIFGMSGISLYYIIIEPLKFLIFFITPILTYVITIYINKAWKKIAKSRYYRISSTQNLIGKKGEVVLKVDERGGVIKILSHTPMKYEKMHVKPLNCDSVFEKEDIVYVCDVKNGFLLVDNNINSIKLRRRGKNEFSRT